MTARTRINPPSIVRTIRAMRGSITAQVSRITQIGTITTILIAHITQIGMNTLIALIIPTAMIITTIISPIGPIVMSIITGLIIMGIATTICWIICFWGYFYTMMINNDSQRRYELY